MRFYGQQGEDMIAWELFKTVSNGFFVDVGAFDGIASNNTLVFEQSGWNGVCFEANPKTFRKLETNRNCTLMNAIVGEMLSEGEPFGVDDNVPGISRRSTNREALLLPVITLNYALSILGVNLIDYVSIDVEGWELQVLQGFDILKYAPRLVVIEKNGNSEVDDYFERNGYLLGKRHYFNDFYLRDEADADVIFSMTTNMENGKLMDQTSGDGE